MESQKRALKEYVRNHGLTNVRWYTDVISGATSSRPAFDKLQRRVFQGKISTILVWKLDRISRKGIREGINILGDWLEKDVRVVSVTQGIDYSGEIGKAIAGLLFALARMERENLIENTKRGMAAAKARGVKLGRRAKIKAADIEALLDKGKTMTEIAEHFNMTRQALYACLRREGRKMLHK